MLLMIHLEMWCAKLKWYFSKGVKDINIICTSGNEHIDYNKQ